jgi:hypothetical protein
VSRYITWTRRLDVFVYFLKREISSLAAMWDAHWKIQPYGLTSAIGTCKLIQDDARVCNIPIGVVCSKYGVSMTHWATMLTLTRFLTIRE